MTTRTLPKSLHTVSVIVAVAKLFLVSAPHYNAYGAVHAALQALGYKEEEDIYSLTQQAIKKLNKAAQS